MDDKLQNMFDRSESLMLQNLTLSIKEVLYLILIKTILDKYQIKISDLVINELEKEINNKYKDHPNRDELLSTIQDAFVEFKYEIGKL